MDISIIFTSMCCCQQTETSAGGDDLTAELEGQGGSRGIDGWWQGSSA